MKKDAPSLLQRLKDFCATWPSTIDNNRRLAVYGEKSSGKKNLFISKKKFCGSRKRKEKNREISRFPWQGQEKGLRPFFFSWRKRLETARKRLWKPSYFLVKTLIIKVIISKIIMDVIEKTRNIIVNCSCSILMCY